MDPEAEEALRELEQGERWASHPPRQEQQTACDAPQLPNFAILCSTLQEILKGVDVTSATFGQVRIELARRLKVTEEALEPCRQQLGDIVKGFLEQPNAIPKSADRPVKSWRNHYGGVWSHTEDPQVRAPQSMPKGEFGRLLLETSESVFKTAVAGGKKARLNRLDKASVWEELHQNGKPHYHFICLADDPWSCVPLARALRAKGINVDFSHDHDYYWTSVIYVAVPSSLPAPLSVSLSVLSLALCFAFFLFSFSRSLSVSPSLSLWQSISLSVCSLCLYVKKLRASSARNRFVCFWKAPDGINKRNLLILWHGRVAEIRGCV